MLRGVAYLSNARRLSLFQQARHDSQAMALADRQHCHRDPVRPSSIMCAATGESLQAFPNQTSRPAYARGTRMLFAHPKRVT